VGCDCSFSGVYDDNIINCFTVILSVTAKVVLITQQISNNKVYEKGVESWNSELTVQIYCLVLDTRTPGQPLEF